MTSNFTAAELREFADRLETRSFDYQPNPFCLHCAAALREYAALKEAAEMKVKKKRAGCMHGDGCADPDCEGSWK